MDYGLHKRDTLGLGIKVLKFSFPLHPNSQQRPEGEGEKLRRLGTKRDKERGRGGDLAIGEETVRNWNMREEEEVEGLQAHQVVGMHS